MDESEIRSGGRILVVTALLTLVQAIVFYEHEAASLTLLVGLGLGLWLRHWSAGVWALASFAVAFVIAAGTGWMEQPRVADAVLGAALAFLGGAIGGGILQLLRRERAAEPGRAPGR